jgi:DNA end-binding protein Ku
VREPSRAIWYLAAEIACFRGTPTAQLPGVEADVQQLRSPIRYCRYLRERPSQGRDRVFKGVTMAARSAWKGFLKLSLVSVPVKAYTVTASGGGEIHLNQLHAECHSRIQYKKVCPIHGEVKGDEIVSGYEYSKGQYVIVDTEELNKLRTEDEKAIRIDTFVTPDTLDPVYYSGKAYYLVPDGPVGQKPYAVLRQAMIEEKRHAVAQIVLHGREQTVLLRPLEKLLGMSLLNYDHQVTKPSAFEEEAPEVEISAQELKLAKTLIDMSTAKAFDFAAYKDVYTEKLTKLIEAKIAGEEIVAPPVHEHAQIINLMDALKASVANAQQKEPAGAKPPKKMAPSRSKEAGARKRKTS